MWVHVQVTHIKEPSGNSISCSQFFKGIWFIFLYVYKKFSVKKWNTCLHYCSNLSSLKDFLNIFERRLFYSLSLHYYSIKNTAKTVILWKIITISYYYLKCNLFMWWQSWIFRSHYSSVSHLTWSFRNHSYMLVLCSWNISYYYQC